jgi:hypothetical protein
MRPEPQVSKTSDDKEQTPFAEFTQRHEHLNRFFWSTDASYHLVHAQIASLADDLPLRKLITSTFARQYTFAKYLARYQEGQPRQRATVADLKRDLFQNVRHLAYSLVVQEASNLEQYLRDWTVEAAHIELEALGNRQQKRSEQLLSVLKDLEYNSRLSISLRSLASYFPVVIKTLNSTTHKRSFTPFLSTPIPGVTCFDAAQMWREIRNLIVHRGGRLNADFVNAWSPIWQKIIDDAVSSGSKVQRANLRLTKRIPLSKRHVVFCLATCFQTAVVLHIALGGKPPVEVKRLGQPLAES